MALRRPTPGIVYALLLVLIVVIAALPLIGALTAAAIGSAAGCRVDEAGSYPCLVMGSDIGEMLSIMFVMGWLMFVTIPIGGLLLLIWVVALIVHLVRARTRRGR